MAPSYDLISTMVMNGARVPWSKVGSGQLADREAFVIERRSFNLPVPKAVATFPIWFRSYRWRLIRADGSVSEQGGAKERVVVEAMVNAYRVDGSGDR